MAGEEMAWAPGDEESVGPIVPECDFELGACLGEAEEGVAAVPAKITARAAAELAPGAVQASVTAIGS